MEQRISIERLEQAVNLFGSFDGNIRLLEQEFSVSVTNRDGELRVNGDVENTVLAAKAIQALLTLSSRGESIGEQTVRYVIGLVRAGKEEQIGELTADVLCITAKGRPVKPKTIGQKEYIQSVLKNTVTIGVGPAGTGKTYLAVAAAVHDANLDLVLVGLANSELIRAGQAEGIRTAQEFFADRNYTDEGLLVSRKLPDAVITDEDFAVARVVRAVKEGAIESASGKLITVKPDTICIHGDNVHALEFAGKIRTALTEAGVEVKPV